MEALIRIQKDLKAPKDKTAQMGQYSYQYRSAEAILAAVKPLLGQAILVMSDAVIEIGPRIYVKATATIKEGQVSESADGWAREQDHKRGLDAAQVTGGCSSYARKYALQGLFMIDDGSDLESLPPDNAPPGATRWDKPAPGTAPANAPPSDAGFAPPAAAPPTGQVPAPTPDQRKWLKCLWDFYVTQAGGRTMDKAGMHKLLGLCQMHMQRYPGSMNDVEQLKKWIKIEELCA